MQQAERVQRFRALHERGCFVLPNPWDVGTLRWLERAGFQAVATTSAGMSFSRGLPDEVSSVSCAAMLAHVRELVAASALPLNADFQNGYADDPQEVAANVALCVETGCAGLSIEDASGDPASPLYPFPLALERIRAARAAIDASATGVVLTARCEARLVGVADTRRVILERLTAYAEAGADCLFAPGVREPVEIEEIVRAVAPRPVNVLVSSPGPGLSVDELAAIGVRRISVGSALSRAAWGGFIRAVEAIAAGRFDTLGEAASFAQLNEAFR